MRGVRVRWAALVAAAVVIGAAVWLSRKNPEIVAGAAGTLLAFLRPVVERIPLASRRGNSMKIQLTLTEHGLGTGDIDLGHWETAAPDLGPLGNALASKVLAGHTETAAVHLAFGDGTVTLTGEFDGDLPLLPATIKAGNYTEPCPDWLAKIGQTVAPDGVDAKLVAAVVA